MKHIYKIIIIAFIFFASCFGVFKLMQNNEIYQHTLGKISSNYISNGDERYNAKISYLEITNENILHWDVVWYHNISKYGYVLKQWEHSEAFFPLFPFIWHLTTLSPVGICCLNFLMFCIGLIIFASIFKMNKIFYFIFSLPMIVIFIIPYTEATFFLCGSLVIYGFLKNHYWLYFIAMILLAMTRNSFALILPALFATEILFLIQHHNFLLSLKRFTFSSLPLIIGTVLVSIIQLLYGSKSFFGFTHAQSYWRHYLSFPDLRNINDWSHESFGMNLPTLILCLMLIFYLIVVLLYHFKILKYKSVSLFNLNSGNKQDYLLVVSIFCCIAAFLGVMFFQHGCLNGLSRYVLATPYFFIFLILSNKKYINITPKYRLTGFLIFIFSILFLFYIISYGNFGFAYLGGLILLLFMGLWLFADFYQHWLYKTIICINFTINVIWTTYMFNILLSNGWIFT
ncbi:MAG: hypothetical protein LBR28_03145 [Bacteroidales bacterium]|jgi:hypothetical protein|nr:hypothetical protein [Bacteroidales bacterium]